MDYQDTSDNLLESIAKLKDDYYSKNQKNTFFKKTQKNDCANLVLYNIDKFRLFSKTLFIIPDKKIIYYDYTFFKTYMTADIYDDFLDYENQLTHEWIQSMESYELHLNIQSLSISAFERYKGFIEKVLERYPPVSPSSLKMSKLCVYYTPSIIENILNFLSPFIQHLKDKIVFYSKNESPNYLEELFKV